MEVVIGSRGSRLSLAQRQRVIDELRRAFPKLKIRTKIIKTEGDKNTKVPLAKMPGQGVFVKELERKLMAREIDIAVHSLKDLPTSISKGLEVGAILKRTDPRDVLMSRDNLKLDELPKNAVIGTGSPRRAMQLKALRNDLKIAEIRGNVGTRIRKLDDGEYDAIVIAAAGVVRLGLEARITQYLPLDVMLPAPGQGALAVEIRAYDKETRGVVQRLDDRVTHAVTDAERMFLKTLGGGCIVPIAAYGKVIKRELILSGLVAGESGVFRGISKGSVESSGEVGVHLAKKIMAAHGAELQKTLFGNLALGGKRIVVTLAQDSYQEVADKLTAFGGKPISFPAIRIEPIHDHKLFHDMAHKVSSYDWIIFTSANGVSCFMEALISSGVMIDSAFKHVKTAAIGPITAMLLEKYGVHANFIPGDYTSAGVARSIKYVKGRRVLLPRADIATEILQKGLRARGAKVDEIAVYRTVPNSKGFGKIKKMLRRKSIQYVIFGSASSASNFIRLINSERQILNGVKLVSIGPETTKAIKKLGLDVYITAKEHTGDGLVEALVDKVNGPPSKSDAHIDD